MLHIYVDADACPVKDEIYLVALRYGLEVTLVANAWMRHPPDPIFHLQLVNDAHDAADDWIAERAGVGDLVITADIPLAGRSLERGARVLRPTGHPFDENNIGEGLAQRELMADLRESGLITGGPPPFSDKDRARFAQALDREVQALRRDQERARRG